MWPLALKIREGVMVVRPRVNLRPHGKLQMSGMSGSNRTFPDIDRTNRTFWTCESAFLVAPRPNVRFLGPPAGHFGNRYGIGEGAGYPEEKL